MTNQQAFVPFAQSKTPEERRAYVDANPGKYKPRAQWLQENAMRIEVSNLIKEVKDLKDIVLKFSKSK